MLRDERTVYNSLTAWDRATIFSIPRPYGRHSARRTPPSSVPGVRAATSSDRDGQNQASTPSAGCIAFNVRYGRAN